MNCIFFTEKCHPFHSLDSALKTGLYGDGNTIVMTHVVVYLDHRGHGVAGKLTQVGLEYAKEKKPRVIPMCPYIAAYIRRNPQYAELTKHQGN